MSGESPSDPSEALPLSIPSSAAVGQASASARARGPTGDDARLEQLQQEATTDNRPRVDSNTWFDTIKLRGKNILHRAKPFISTVSEEGDEQTPLISTQDQDCVEDGRDAEANYPANRRRSSYKHPKCLILKWMLLLLGIVGIGYIVMVSVNWERDCINTIHAPSSQDALLGTRQVGHRRCVFEDNTTTVLQVCDWAWWPWSSTTVIYKKHGNGRVKFIHDLHTDSWVLYVAESNVILARNIDEPSQTFNFTIGPHATIIYNLSISRNNQHMVASTNMGVFGIDLEGQAAIVVNLCHHVASKLKERRTNPLCANQTAVDVVDNCAVAIANNSLVFVDTANWAPGEAVDLAASVLKTGRAVDEQPHASNNPPIVGQVAKLKLRYASPLALQIALSDDAGLRILSAIKPSTHDAYIVTTTVPCGAPSAVDFAWGATSVEGFPSHELMWVTSKSEMYSAVTYTTENVAYPVSYRVKDHSHDIVHSAFWTQDLASCYLVSDNAVHHVKVTRTTTMCTKVSPVAH
eukprot:m.238141 g.238141  ORF g.238141 m.238141 type:complete len:520 (+) comp15285_c0_seq1:2047-3606(+)